MLVWVGFIYNDHCSKQSLKETGVLFRAPTVPCGTKKHIHHHNVVKHFGKRRCFLHHESVNQENMVSQSYFFKMRFDVGVFLLLDRWNLSYHGKSVLLFGRGAEHVWNLRESDNTLVGG